MTEQTGRTVLVVDDDEDIRFLVVTVLEEAGYTVLEASTGAEAVEVVRREQPDLVTLDLGLPDIDGMETCRRLRAFSDAFVIMLTGRTDESDRLAGLDVGADDYMVKPFSPRELRARVGAFLRRSRPAVAATPAGTTAAPAAPAGAPA
ncbi:response regulator, partial [Nocardioides sp. ChNu-153]|uniref:response regulator transcription factor n=1 Tax=Nocardioides sp. ChNu-153 TaxID=2779364 RepID=UPI00264F4EE9